MPNLLRVQYDKLSKLSTDDLSVVDQIDVYFDDSDSTTLMASLEKLPTGDFKRIEVYSSLKEFSTVSMKELLTLHAKRSVIKGDSEYYKKDDPKLHAFLSKLSYTGVEEVCKHLDEFSAQFKTGRVMLKLPRPNRSFASRH